MTCQVLHLKTIIRHHSVPAQALVPTTHGASSAASASSSVADTVVGSWDQSSGSLWRPRCHGEKDRAWT
ncbi:hypothetical protein Taro_004236 [Colocasia esculenta]|uniref:Uncharacterized protein n=1 Tax=Colocasia esculenta TaxID=4460 RepID=A0A843TJJ3_COLES|nr:hypothetical protein [Colocasia esculenta]